MSVCVFVCVCVCVCVCTCVCVKANHTQTSFLLFPVTTTSADTVGNDSVNSATGNEVEVVLFPEIICDEWRT